MTEQEIRVEVEGHPLCGVLRTAWGLRSINDARQFVADVEVPGLLALRSRLLHLRDPEAASWEQPLRGAVAEAWVATLARETAAERALNANDTLLAEQLFDELLRNEHDDEYPITTVNALLGLADVARQRDSVETAASMYDKAIDVADRIGYRFGTSRALVALGYLALVASSANAAIAKFERAKAIAGPIGDRLGLANALLGIGECQQRLHQRDKAIEAIDESMEVFAALRSPVGEANAAQRLAAVLLRDGEAERSAALLEHASDCYARANVPIGAANTLDSLGDLWVKQGDHRKAVEAFRQSAQVSETAGYARGFANATLGVARAALLAELHELAASTAASAERLYLDLDDRPGAINARDTQRASSTDVGTAAAHAAVALQYVEELRADHERSDYQREYRQRFSTVYVSAIDAAVAAHDAGLAMHAIECLAARRLVGLVSSSGTSDRAWLLAGLGARANQRTSRHNPATDMDRRTRIARYLGASAIGAVGDSAAEAVDSAAASSYAPTRIERVLEILDNFSGPLLALAQHPTNPAKVIQVWQQSPGTAALRIVDLDDEQLDVLHRACGPGRSELRADTVAPLRSLIPDPVWDMTQTLTIVATGTLWALPWAALQRSPGDFFGFRPHVLCPSLDLATLLNPEPTADTARPVLWKHSAVLHQHARGLDEAVVLDNTGALRTALLTGSPERSLVAIVGHGRRHDNLTYIELDPGDPLSVADLLGGQLPPRLAMIICGGTETIHDEEPLALGTIVLARGTQQVLTTSMVLADEPTAARVVDAALHRMQQGSTVPEALAASFRRVNETMPLARLPLGRWAALSALGTGGTIRRVETESSGAADGRDHDVNDVAERHHNRR